MAQTQAVSNRPSIAGAPAERAAKILAKSLFRDLRKNGYSHQHIIALSSELIALVTEDIRGDVIDIDEHLEDRRTRGQG